MYTPEQFHDKLAVQRRRIQILFLVHTAVYALALLLMVFQHMTAGMALGVANLLLHFLLIRGQFKGYSRSVTEANLLLGVCQPLTEPRCTGGTGMTDEAFDALALLPIRRGKGRSLMAHNGFAGRLNDMEVRGFEATLHYPVEKNGKTDFRFLNGTLLTAGGQQTFSGDCLLLHKHLLEPGAEQAFLEQHHLCTVTPDSPALQDFLLCAERPEQVPQAVCRHLALLVRAAPGLGAVRLAPDQAAVFLVNRFYSRRIKVRELPDAAALTTNPLPERDAVFALFRWWSRFDNQE
ncbi:MAG: hypothetical protein ACI4OI_03130 [Gemmiger sp.]